MNVDKKSLKQTNFRVDKELLEQLKLRALNLNISLQKYIMEAITEKIIREDKTK